MLESTLYLAIAEEAAQAERSRRYKQAVQLWKNCSRLAYTTKNQHWATSRAEFCSKRVVMG
ncbi:ANR family transcriptional regulator [Vibrio vulnificus]|uniref:ANR family transcriptional regulator n=1 Tax=Vibrio vulnificus TaxID=672 RepID=UPI001FAB68D6|nr:ANR family transcriptional regulator [Vibrio vulnificus]MCJ0820217.1 ANR family transcriptional regulator [Vibrio vulnificus]HDY7526843.1 ANR family transcriptional regulator [Vibrio vulnificus]HDY8063149.1 ANR family transcriptional regulator [Vibrio vulnificus]HDY8137611.1 ANR family transcriptional regulator [Vibrio vulnificus]HDY8216556.1 ANR family transcriptional regulator [Vibrio vulnificus]